MTKRDVLVRFSEHIRCATRNHDIDNNYVMPFYNAIRKYGADSFIVEKTITKTFASFREAEMYEGSLIRENASMLEDSGYNLNNMNHDGKRNYSTQIIIKIRQNKTGNTNPFFGKKHTDETRKLLSDKAKLRLSVPENNPRYGYKYTEQDKAKHRESKRKHGRPFIAAGIHYETLSEAAEKYNLTKQAIKFRIESKSFLDWYYI